MKRGQRGILKLLAEGGNWFTPANIAFNIDMSQDYISKECRSLTDQGFLKRHSGGTNPFYQVRDQGRIALEEDSLEFTCEYEGQVSEDLWAVLVYPGRRPLRVAGDQYYGSGEISWGPQGGDGGAFNLAQNLLRHAVSDEAAEEHAFEFYRDTTRTLEKNFRLTEADIEDWVAEQQQAVDE